MFFPVPGNKNIIIIVIITIVTFAADDSWPVFLFLYLSVLTANVLDFLR